MPHPYLLALVLAFLPASACVADWPMLSRDARRSGATPDEIRPPFARKWYRTFIDEGLHTGVQPVVAGGKVFIGTMRGNVHAIDAETGKDAWVHQGGAPVLHAAAVSDGKVFVAVGDRMRALDAATGRLLWDVKTGAAIWNAPVVHDGVVVFGGRDGLVRGCEAASGRVVWSAGVGAPVIHSPAIDEKANRVYAGAEDMHVYAFDLRDGKQSWKSPKLPGVSFRGYHPVVAPDGSVIVTVTPLASGEVLQQVLLDMVKEVFGNFASWRIKDEGEKRRIRAENFELMKDPGTHRKQLDYLRKRLTDQPGMQTLFVLDAATGRQRFVAPVVYAESMNGPCSPPIVTCQGKVIVKYSALLRSRYEHYSPFLNVGYLDTRTGHVEPVMDQSRTYGWHDSLLLVHDEQSQLSAGGRVLFNTHQDNINALDLDTLKGYPQAMAHNVHEVKPGTAAAIWSAHLQSQTADRSFQIPVGWEWFARGTSVYGGGSVIDTPIVIDGDSFYFLPTHELNAGVVLVAYKMDPNGTASTRAPEPKQPLTDDQWQTIARDFKWDWDMLAMPRLDHVVKGPLPGKVAGTLLNPKTDEAKDRVAKITDPELDRLILAAVSRTPRTTDATLRERLIASVQELISTQWKPLLFPAGKHPTEAYRLFVDPSETLYTLALAYPHLPRDVQERVKAFAATIPLFSRTYDPSRGEVRSLYDEVHAALVPRLQNDLVRSDTARVYTLWLFASATGDRTRLTEEWPKLRERIDDKPGKDEYDLGNARIAGLIAACRIAKESNDPILDSLLPKARSAIRTRLAYEFAHTEGGVITSPPTARTVFGRWRNLTPEVGQILAHYARDAHQHLMEVYVDYHRPTWWLAWEAELLWRNENPFSFPTLSREVFAARSFILRESPEKLADFIDIPWCKGDEYYIQKLAIALSESK